MANLEGKIRELNREILRLKTAHPVASSMITFHGVYDYAPDDDGKTHIYEITYVEGEQPILTTQAFNDRTWDNLFGEPNGNKQLMYDMDAHHWNDDQFALFSTRQILSVRKLS